MLEEITESLIGSSGISHTVKLKTNGFNFGETLRGNFKLEELGTGKLFTGSSQGPVIHIKTKESYIIINFKDPEQTRRLYDKLNNTML